MTRALRTTVVLNVGNRGFDRLGMGAVQVRTIQSVGGQARPALVESHVTPFRLTRLQMVSLPASCLRAESTLAWYPLSRT